VDQKKSLKGTLYYYQVFTFDVVCMLLYKLLIFFYYYLFRGIFFLKDLVVHIQI